MTATDILLQILSGLSRGMVLFIVASGLTLIFGVMRIANFTHGSFYMLAAFVSYSVTLAVGSRDLGFIVSLVLAPLAVAAVGVMIEVGLLRRIATRPHQYQLILTYALTLVFADGAKFVWGANTLSVPRPAALDGGIAILGRPFPTYYLALIVIGLAIAILLEGLLNRTRIGKILRAAVADGEMVGALGINVLQLNTVVFAFGAWLAGLGGALAAPVGAISIGMDTSIIIESFAVVIIGGAGNILGALIGALLIGVVQSLGILVMPKLAIAFVFIALCSVLVFRPQGLLGRAT
jgi:branched-chain amino acid transport system permease protein